MSCIVIKLGDKQLNMNSYGVDFNEKKKKDEIDTKKIIEIKKDYGKYTKREKSMLNRIKRESEQ